MFNLLSTLVVAQACKRTHEAGVHRIELSSGRKFLLLMPDGLDEKPATPM